MTTTSVSAMTATPHGQALKRRGLPFPAAATHRRDLTGPVDEGRRDFPGPASATPAPPHYCTTILTPVPTPAHDFPRAIRVRRSPR
ncbi:hypothetical protein AB0D57_00105 [Streptomyces sp. NPDC048275]|uniref:hypothetical protein n=1 Tax=Streptomyces sp. NPDC048275 TaxID=3155629 RepID=UPI0033F5065C